MTRRTAPASRPWEAPGYRFLTAEACAWLGGYVPQGMQPSPTAGLRARATAAKKQAAQAGTGWRNGTIPGGLGGGKGAR